MDINPEDETSYTTQYQEALLKYVEKEYCAKHRRVTVNILQTSPSSNPISSATASASCQTCLDPHDWSSDDKEYLTPHDVAETTPGPSYHAARLLTATTFNFNPPPEAPKNWGQINPNLNDYHSDQMEFSSTYWIPEITDWWHQQEETHSKYPDLCDLVCNIFLIIPHAVGVEVSFSFGRDGIGWRQSKTTGRTIREKVVVTHFTPSNNRILGGSHPEWEKWNTENDSEMKKDSERRQLHTMTKVHNFLAMWQGWHNLRAQQMESCAQNKQMTPMGYISDTEEIIKASWSPFQHDGAAAFKLSEWSPLAPPLSAKDLPGGRNKMLNVRQIRWINCHPVYCDEDSGPDSIADTEDGLNWNGDWDNPNDSEDDCATDDESDLEQDNMIKHPESPEQWDVSAGPNGCWLIRPTQRSKGQSEKVLVTVNESKTRRNKGVKQK